MPAPLTPVKILEGIMARLTRIEQRLNNILAHTGLSVPAQGVTQVDGSLVVQNGEAKSGNYAPGSTGWHLDHAGNAEFNDLTIRGGIIGNDALADPSTFGSGSSSVLGFNISTSFVLVAYATIPIPAGFTRALIHCTVDAAAQNTTASTDFMYVEAYMQTSVGVVTTGGQSFSEATAGAWANAAASWAGVLTSIGTGNITVGCAVKSGTAWAIAASNIANVNASVTFLR
jgi:hypothetical protein